MPARRDRDKAGLTLFTDELRAARQRAGWSAEELADKLGYSASLVRMVESGHRTASPDFAKQCDKAFGTPGFSDQVTPPTPGTFMRIELRLRDLPFPASYRPFVPHETAARVLRIFEPSFVTGLFQTPEYARAVLARRPYTSNEGVENLLALRLARQEILTREDPPLVYWLMDESVLHRSVAPAEVMRAQLTHLADLAMWPNIGIQVVPYSAGGHIGLLGAFTIAEMPDGSVTGFLENSADGQTVEDSGHVAQIVANFDALRGDALTVAASRDLILKVAEEKWNVQRA
jgi:transcriptional regulator with XRE-family HTH domain